ncbi:hypothetical protein GOP47_0026898 [Adiantum capillus-veneris]|nr:hypothetical protein GOP47_0026898 [Adiantum capillus-veneris]
MRKSQEEFFEAGMLPQPSVEDVNRILRTVRKMPGRFSLSHLHPFMIKSGLDAHVSAGNHLVVVLIQSGNIPGAHLVFERLAHPNVGSWNALIGGYNNCNQSQFALTLYEKFQDVDSLKPTGYTYVELLKACKKLKDMERGLLLHSEVATTDLLKTDPFVGSALLDMYAKCGSLSKAHQVFDELPAKDVVTWTALIGGYAEHEHGEEALELFGLMRQQGFLPNAVTFICSLKACGSKGFRDRGEVIHAELEKKGLLEGDVFIGSALVDMYVRCGSLSAAKKVLDTLPTRNVVLWNTLIAGYAENGLGNEALGCLEQMHLEGVLPDAVTFLLSLKACGSIGQCDLGQELHAEVERKGILGSDPNLGNTLVDMYTKCGLLDLAQEVFDKLPLKDVVSWTALIVGYSEQGFCDEAIKLFEEMQCEDVSPNSVTVICCLRACGIIKAIDKGEELHAYSDRHGLLEKDIVVGNSVIDMYAKCGVLVKAQEVFDKLLERNVVSWNVLLTGYCEHGWGEKALECFKLMQQEGVSPTTITFACILKACGIVGSVEECALLHTEIEKRGLLEVDLVVGNALVDTYAKCGFLSEAQRVFEGHPFKDVLTWSILISGYCEYGRCHEAFEFVKQMQLDGHSWDTVTLICMLKACAFIGDAELGREIHTEVERQGLLQKDILVGSTLVDMYAKCGAIVRAQEVFEELSIRNEITWNALIVGLAAHGHGEQALRYLGQMVYEGFSPDSVTFVGSLIACASIEAIDKGQELHVEVERRGFFERDPSIGSALVDFYTKCGSLTMAQEVFDKLPFKNQVTWTTLIAGYVEKGYGDAALECFEQMQLEGIFPDDLTFVWSLKACCIVGALEKGEDIQAEIERRGLSKNATIGTALVNMYAEFGLLTRAQDIFDKLPARDAATWNALIAGYANHDHGEKAVLCLEQMEANGVSPDAVTMLCSLKACGMIGATSKGQMLHTDVERFGLLETDLFVGNTVVAMYASCGSLARAQQVFDILHRRDVVTWNAMMVAYVKQGLGGEALELVDRMQLEGVAPSAVTFICSLKACGSIGAWDVAAEIHAEIERQGFLETDQYIGNTLVDLYAKWGVLAKAQEVFDKLPFQGVVSWTALMKGYAQLGESESVFSTYEKMLGKGIKPDPVTFVVILSTCSRSRLHTKSQTFVDVMSEQYGITPSLEHDNCVVSLLGHTGELDGALSLINQRPLCSNLGTWRIVLDDCAKLGNTRLGKQAFEHAVHLDQRAPVGQLSKSIFFRH